MSQSDQPEKNGLQLVKPLARLFILFLFFARPWAPSAQQNASEACRTRKATPLEARVQTFTFLPEVPLVLCYCFISQRRQRKKERSDPVLSEYHMRQSLCAVATAFETAATTTAATTRTRPAGARPQCVSLFVCASESGDDTACVVGVNV